MSLRRARRARRNNAVTPNRLITRLAASGMIVITMGRWTIPIASPRCRRNQRVTIVGGRTEPPTAIAGPRNKRKREETASTNGRKPESATRATLKRPRLPSVGGANSARPDTPATEARNAEPTMTIGTPIAASARETWRRSCSGISNTPALPKMLPMMTLCDSHAMAPIRIARGSLRASDSLPVSACSTARARSPACP